MKSHIAFPNGRGTRFSKRKSPGQLCSCFFFFFFFFFVVVVVVFFLKQISNSSCKISACLYQGGASRDLFWLSCTCTRTDILLG